MSTITSGAEGAFSTVTDRVESAATDFATDVTSVGGSVYTVCHYYVDSIST